MPVVDPTNVFISHHHRAEQGSGPAGPGGRGGGGEPGQGGGRGHEPVLDGSLLLGFGPAYRGVGRAGGSHPSTIPPFVFVQHIF